MVDKDKKLGIVVIGIKDSKKWPSSNKHHFGVGKRSEMKSTDLKPMHNPARLVGRLQNLVRQL